MSKLKSCPFCGSTSMDVIQCSSANTFWWIVQCNGTTDVCNQIYCDASGPRSYKSEEEAIAMWNRRTSCESDNFLGKKIKEIRLEKGLTLEEFGKKIGAHSSNVSAWKKGKNSPNKARLKAIADYAGISVGELTGDVEMDSFEDMQAQILDLQAQINELRNIISENQ